MLVVQGYNRVLGWSDQALGGFESVVLSVYDTEIFGANDRIELHDSVHPMHVLRMVRKSHSVPYGPGQAQCSATLTLRCRYYRTALHVVCI